MKYDKMLLTPWQVNDSAAAKMVQIGGSALLIKNRDNVTDDQLYERLVGEGGL